MALYYGGSFSVIPVLVAIAFYFWFMSRRNKLKKFAEVLAFPNVYENYDATHPGLTGANGVPVELKGRWKTDHFLNDNPITLELACGKGEYALGLARLYPERNFIGVDIKGARIWRGAKTALENNMGNVAFLRTRIEQIDLFFEPSEVDEIWIVFPDPFLRNSKANRRLTSPFFLNQYAKILKPGSLLHLKTDEPVLYEYTLLSIAQHPDFRLIYHNQDIYANPLISPELDIKTFYEQQHLANGKRIHYIQAEFLTR